MNPTVLEFFRLPFILRAPGDQAGGGGNPDPSPDSSGGVPDIDDSFFDDEAPVDPPKPGASEDEGADGGGERGNDPSGESTSNKDGPKSTDGGDGTTKYAGKYASVPDLEQGYRNADTFIGTLKAEKVALQAQLKAAQAGKPASKEPTSSASRLPTDALATLESELDAAWQGVTEKDFDADTKATLKPLFGAMKAILKASPQGSQNGDGPNAEQSELMQRQMATEVSLVEMQFAQEHPYYQKLKPAVDALGQELKERGPDDTKYWLQVLTWATIGKHFKQFRDKAVTHKLSRMSVKDRERLLASAGAGSSSPGGQRGSGAGSASSDEEFFEGKDSAL